MWAGLGLASWFIMDVFGDLALPITGDHGVSLTPVNGCDALMNMFNSITSVYEYNPRFTVINDRVARIFLKENSKGFVDVNLGVDDSEGFRALVVLHFPAASEAAYVASGGCLQTQGWAGPGQRSVLMRISTIGQMEWATKEILKILALSPFYGLGDNHPPLYKQCSELNSQAPAMFIEDCVSSCLICCLTCCWGMVVTLAFSANVIAFVGLSHTRMIDLEPYCPHNYWEGSLTMVFLRFLVFSIASCTMACSRQLAEQSVHVCCVVCVALISLLLILSVSITDTVITSQAISALNCSVALRDHGKDNDPLLIVSGSAFVAVDWVMCILVCCSCAFQARSSAEIVSN